MVALRALEHFLAVGEPLVSFLLHARAHGVADQAAGLCVLGRGHRLDTEGKVALRELCALAQGCRLDVEAAEVLRELHSPWLEVGEEERGMVQGSPQWH